MIRAYRDLEARGFIESRPRSGFVVRRTCLKHLAEPAAFTARHSSAVNIGELIFEVFEAMKQPTVVQFGSACVNPELFPREMNRAGVSAARGLEPATALDYLPPGNLELRRLIALRYLDTGQIVAPDDIVVTTGALEAISLCLRAVTRPGDTVAVETPTHFPTLQMLEWMGLREAEIATDPRKGIDLVALEQALEKESIRACIVTPTFQNPLGSCMPEERRRALARLAERYKIPVIEDDAHAELYFGASRPRSVKSFDRAGWVLHDRTVLEKRRLRAAPAPIATGAIGALPGNDSSRCLGISGRLSDDATRRRLCAVGRVAAKYRCSGATPVGARHRRQHSAWPDVLRSAPVSQLHATEFRSRIHSRDSTGRRRAGTTHTVGGRE